jgi:hypothetical protein
MPKCFVDFFSCTYKKIAVRRLAQVHAMRIKLEIRKYNGADSHPQLQRKIENRIHGSLDIPIDYVS